MDRDRHFDLFALGKTPKVGMDHSAPKGVDLSVLKDHVVYALAVDIERKHGINTGVGSHDRCKILERCGRGQAFRAASVNNDRDLARGPRPSGLVFPPCIPLLTFYCNFFCHKTPSSKFKV